MRPLVADTAGLTDLATALRAMRARIESGELRPDRPVPSESQLQQELGVARGTARKGIALLREQGLVVTVRGRGSFVSPTR